MGARARGGAGGGRLKAKHCLGVGGLEREASCVWRARTFEGRGEGAVYGQCMGRGVVGYVLWQARGKRRSAREVTFQRCI